MVAQPAPCRCAVVTGANRGLGLALARGLAESGAHVVVTAREGGAASSAVAAALCADGLSAEAYVPPLDVGDLRSVRAFGEFCAAAAVAPDALVNNAAVCEEGWSDAVVRRALRTNALGPFWLARALLPGMRRHGGGRILSVSSGDGELAYLHSALQDDLRAARTAPQLLRVLGRARPPRQRYGAAPAHGPTPAYALSKAALNAGSRILAAEEAGVWVGAVCPGDVRTRMCVDPEARARAVPADAAVPSVLWLLERAAGLPSGRFWRDREEISF